MAERKHVDVAVLGGGISGLTAGFLLLEQGRSVIVLEAASQPGGSIRTWKSDGFVFELGPNTVLNNTPEIDALCEAAGVLASRLGASPSSKKRFVVKGDEPVALPRGPLGLLRTPLFSARAKLRLLREPFISRPAAGVEESIAQFARRRLGREFFDYVVSPFVSGVYAGDPEKLSVQHATVKIHALEERHGSLIRGALAGRKGPAPAGGLFSFRDGLETLPRALAERLGAAWRARASVIGVRRNEDEYTVKAVRDDGDEEWSVRSVVCALPAAAASSALAPLGGDFPARIGTLPYADVAVVCLGFRREQVRHPLDGFGLLAPAVEHRYVLGCLFPSSIFPGRAPDECVALTAFLGGARHPDRVTADTEEILAATVRDLRGLLGTFGEPVLHRVERWRPAIPQYVVGHGALKAVGAEFERGNPGLYLSGNLLHGVSVADCIRNATAVAGRVGEFLNRAR